MIRSLLALLLFAALPAAAFDVEKWLDDLTNRQMERWKREKIETALKGRDPEERLQAVEGLSYGDPDALVAFAAALSDSDARVRQAAANQLWRAEKRAEPFRPQLTKALEDPDANVVAHAAGALQASGVREAELVPVRQRVLAAPDASVTSRFFAARGLVGYEPPAKIVGPMIEYLERNTQAYTGSVTDRNRHNVELGVRALERLVKNTKDRAIIPALAHALDATKGGQIPLMKALGHFDPRPEGWTAALLRQLESPNPNVRHEALAQLRSVKDEKEIFVWAPRVSAMLQDPDRSVRSNALWALGTAAGLAAGEIDKVIAAAADPEASVRRNAIRALGDMAEAGQPIPAATRARLTAAALPVVEKASQDGDKEVRDEAASSLRKIGDPAATLAATPGPAEASGLAVLRARKVKLDAHSWFGALQKLDVELIGAFLDAGVSPNAVMSDIGPPLRVMLFGSDACAPNVRPTKAEAKAIVKMLLERGADIHAADRHGNTAITEAASKGCDRELIRALIKAGANIRATNASGLTPFEMGLWSGHDGLEEFIAAGYRLPPEKVKLYLDGYKDRPAAIAMVKKAAGAAKK